MQKENNELEEVFNKLKKLPQKEQKAIIELLNEELAWRTAFQNNETKVTKLQTKIRSEISTGQVLRLE